MQDRNKPNEPETDTTTEKIHEVVRTKRLEIVGEGREPTIIIQGSFMQPVVECNFLDGLDAAKLLIGIDRGIEFRTYGQNNALVAALSVDTDGTVAAFLNPVGALEGTWVTLYDPKSTEDPK